MDPETEAFTRSLSRVSLAIDEKAISALNEKITSQEETIKKLTDQMRIMASERDTLRAEREAQNLMIAALKRSNQLLLKSSIDLINFQEQLSNTTRAYQDLAMQLRDSMSNEDANTAASLINPIAPVPQLLNSASKTIFPDSTTANVSSTTVPTLSSSSALPNIPQENTIKPDGNEIPEKPIIIVSQQPSSDELHPHIDLLQGFPLFASFPRSVLEQISLCSYELKRKEGQIIITKGEEGAEMFFIVDGVVAVVVDGKELIFKFRRTATIVAKSDCILAVVTKQKLDEIVEAANQAVQLIMEEFTINKEIWWKQQQYIKAQEKFGAEFVNDIARKDLKSLELFAEAPDSFIDSLAMTLKCLVYKAGEIVIHLNEDSDAMYFVLSGTVEVVGSTGVVHAEIAGGSFFGEVGILLNMKRTASIRAKVESRLFKLQRDNLDEVVSEYPSVKNKLKESADERFYLFQMRQSFAEEEPTMAVPDQFDLEVGQNVLSKLTFFEDVDYSIVTELAMLMTRRTWESGEHIIRCGEDGKSMFFLVAGDADVITEFGDVVDQFHAPDAYFGEVAIIEQVPRTASVRCITTCSTYELKKEDKAEPRTPIYGPKDCTSTEALERITLIDSLYENKIKLYMPSEAKASLLLVGDDEDNLETKKERELTLGERLQTQVFESPAVSQTLLSQPDESPPPPPPRSPLRNAATAAKTLSLCSDDSDDTDAAAAAAKEAAAKDAIAKIEADKVKSGFSIGFAEDRNKRHRRTMEDAHSFVYRYGAVDGQGFFAIFDGHAGKTAAEWCGAHLHETLHTLILERPTTPIPELLNEAFVRTDSQLAARKLSSGCTAVVAFTRIETRENEKKRVLYTANVGDARAVLSRDGKALRLSYDHKGTDPHETQRIQESGGFVVNGRVNGVLAVTRALGDVTMKDYILGNPYTTETVLNDADNVLILACDGVWDVCSDQDAISFVNESSRANVQTASDDLLAYALEKFSTDNLSVMVIQFLDTKTFS
ncbi:UNVERIFIED_CONTAM: Protein phosphatase 2C 1 [Siphonaria sp. JEL0065]|nr:Protein phosphatase 2C 1 [Siphonaria sp. JEL0065]